MPIAVRAPAEVSGTPLVLLHAFPLDSSMWDAVAALLPEVPVVTVDAPGFGDSQAREPGLDAFALDVVAAVRELGVEQAVVAGLSMGGYVALSLAQQAPGLLAGLGLLSTKAGADTDAARGNRLRMADAAERGDDGVALGMLDGLIGPTTAGERPAVVADLRDRLAGAPNAGIVWAQRSMAARPARLEVLRTLPPLPALVLRGTEDALMAAPDATAMADALSTELVELDGVGHLAALEAPEPVAAALARLHAQATSGSL